MEEKKKLIRFEYEEKGKSLKELSIEHEIKLGTLKSWSSREKWNKKKEKSATGNATFNKKLQPERKKVAEVAKDKEGNKLEVQKQIIKYNGKLNDKEIMELSGTPKTTYYRYKNELLEYMSKMSQELLGDAVKYAYPDKEHLIKRLLGERRNILITAISNIKKTPTDKDYQQGISKSIENINKVLDTIFKDMGILKYEDQLKYLVEEKESIKQTKLSDILEEEKWQYHH